MFDVAVVVHEVPPPLPPVLVGLGLALALVGGGALPVLWYAATYCTLMVPPEVVAEVGEVQPHTPLGYPPPIARSRMIERLWSNAACQVLAPIWLSLTVKYAAPSR